ncbi:hypothetical protein NDU88_003436 [Pleurodeles waltl]|uniref:Uncharacterized protein n=1 Tax=Pleurodeles waltl TaxID=8319 RepID=A0AAV7LLL4_PLEWA|nr:hypothetical protein NDU88_003436 [Pleurodeles waltl]
MVDTAAKNGDTGLAPYEREEGYTSLCRNNKSLVELARSLPQTETSLSSSAMQFFSLFQTTFSTLSCINILAWSLSQSQLPLNSKRPSGRVEIDGQPPNGDQSLTTAVDPVYPSLRWNSTPAEPSKATEVSGALQGVLCEILEEIKSIKATQHIMAKHVENCRASLGGKISQALDKLKEKEQCIPACEDKLRSDSETMLQIEKLLAVLRLK